MGDRALQTQLRQPQHLPAVDARSRDELPALIRISTAVAAVHRLEEVLETLASESRAALGAAAVTVSRLTADGLHPLAHSGAATDDSGPRLRVPIRVEDDVWGELEVRSGPGEAPFTMADAAFVEAVSAQAGIAIGRAELFTRLATLAYEDQLTGLANRRALEERLEEAVAAAAASGGAVALLFCDLDALKELNDADGHEAGDAALVRVAAALTAAAAAYPDAFISRIGGDEFCVLLPGSGAAAARQVGLEAERLLREHAEQPLSISSGAAELQHPHQRPAELFRAADAAQYIAKRAGRGRVYVAEAGAVAMAAQSGATRRGLRDAARTPTLAARVLALLDGVLVGASPQDRLEGVAVAFADAFDAAGWAVSWRPPGEDVVRTVFEGGRRAHRVAGVPSLRFRGSNDVYRLADYPATAAIMAGGGSFCLRADDPGGDAGERELLRHAGHHALVAAAVEHAGSAWLVELYTDGRSGGLEHERAELRLLMGEAVRGAA
jgi:diguanylate cyclase (GGDEF)-like protein